MSVSMNSTGSGGSEDEEEEDEDTESVHDDDEEDVDEINHTDRHKEVVCLEEEMEEVSPEEDLEVGREVCVLELQKEDPVEFTEYRNCAGICLL